jgi:hypothetical protein
VEEKEPDWLAPAIPLEENILLEPMEEYHECMFTQDRGKEQSKANLTLNSNKKKKKFEYETSKGNEESVECQPTSSKVKVEDLVTEEEERKGLEDNSPVLDRT